MADNNIEQMKKIIENKKKKSAERGVLARADKNIGESRTGKKKFRKGGLFDK